MLATKKVMSREHNSTLKGERGVSLNCYKVCGWRRRKTKHVNRPIYKTCLLIPVEAGGHVRSQIFLISYLYKFIYCTAGQVNRGTLKDFQDKNNFVVQYVNQFKSFTHQLFSCKYETESKNCFEKGEVERFDFISSLF